MKFFTLSLTVNKGEVHAIMGPNGSGKSTLSHVIAGKPGYEVTGSEILFEGEDLLAMSPDERSSKGVFLAFQYPVESPGVATMTFLRTAAAQFVFNNPNQTSACGCGESVQLTPATETH